MHFGEEAAENVLVYEDFSGGNLERPQFKKMMKDSQKIAFAAIVVYRLDRISRNIGDFAECAEFDGEHGIMVYNRSLQRPGKANQIRPMEEWIVAVGKHPGIIAGGDWVRVQAMLDVNKFKSYRRPRSNVAPLSHCSSSNSTGGMSYSCASRRARHVFPLPPMMWSFISGPPCLYQHAPA